MLVLQIVDILRMRVDHHILDTGIVHMNHAISNGRQSSIMSHDDHRRSLLTRHILENFQNLLTRLIIQGACRFITKENFRIFGYRACNGELAVAPLQKAGLESY